jgi:Uma2 family endonuclease
MSTQIPLRVPADIDYPDSDGQPMSDNTLQFQWIVTLQGNLDGMFRADLGVFVAGDLLWYPVEGDNTIRMAPDAMVVFGRPKGYRGSYRQWEEEGIAPQVVFEVRSPGNRPGEMERKFDFYERYGVEEYYVIDPERGRVSGWRRQGGHLQAIVDMAGWISPRLGIRFEIESAGVQIYKPDGRRFATYVELVEQEERERRAKKRERRQKLRERRDKETAQTRAEQERRDKETAQTRAEQERRDKEAAQVRADQERRDREAAQGQAEQERRDREAAQVQAEQERRDKEAAQARAERLAAQLKALGIEPEAEK